MGSLPLTLIDKLAAMPTEEQTPGIKNPDPSPTSLPRT
jgi:hypothetical protein